MAAAQCPDPTPVGLIEPPGLLAAFLAHPPVGFTAERRVAALPSFFADYDLLTTLEEKPRAWLQRLPLRGLWGRLLCWPTRFVGSTVTEYAPLPRSADYAPLVDELLQRYGDGQRLLVVKDLPQDSPLLCAADNACVEAFVRAAQARGFVCLDGMRLAWLAIDFASTEEYLRRQSAKRRTDIRRKLKARAAVQCEIIACGDARFASDAEVARYYALYRNVYAQSEVHFDLLSEGFFRAVLREDSGGGLLFTYHHAGQLIGWKLCYEYGGMLLDKYVGFAYPQAREHNLYFLCWFDNLEYALSRGLTHFVAGWTDSRIKAYLGAQLTPTRHLVYLRNPVLRAALRRLSHWFESEPGQ